MSVKNELRDIYSDLIRIKTECNEALASRGGEPCETLNVLPERIEVLPSGDNYLRDLALKANAQNEAGTVDLVLDGSWGALRNHAFYGNTKLKSVDLSACTEMTQIPSGCFGKCEHLINIKFPPKVKNLAGLAETGMTEITVPATVETMTQINGNANLKKVNFPSDSKVREIGSNTFQSCKKLTDVYFPPVLKTLGSQVLYMTSETSKKVYFRCKPTSIKANSLSTAGITDIYVPWSEGEVLGAPWSAASAVHYDWKAFEHVEVTTLPTRTTYGAGETFDPAGMVVTAYDGGTNIGTIIASPESGYENIEYSTKPFSEVTASMQFYIYAMVNGNKHIAAIDITVSQT